MLSVPMEQALIPGHELTVLQLGELRRMTQCTVQASTSSFGLIRKHLSAVPTCADSHFVGHSHTPSNRHKLTA